MPLVRLVGPWLVRSPRVIAALPWLTGLSWVGAGALAGVGQTLAASLAAVAGSTGLSGLRFLAAFRLENPAMERLRWLFRVTSVALLAVLPWAHVYWSSPRLPPLAVFAPGLCLAAVILLARWLYSDFGAGRAHHWLLPDGDQAWLLIAIFAPFGVAAIGFALLPLAGLAQLLLWMRFSQRRANRV
jgi:hypothetical protein